MPAADPMNRQEESPGLDDATAASETALDSASNPRKRKKSSRACDYCHINHQPCDNAKPRCGYCERHGKNCLYLRPQKKRGPAQGYRSALYSMRESAAAWGALLHLVPTLAPVIEGYFTKEDGKRLIRAIKDPQQQEFYIQTWQQSSVFKTFFGDGSPCDDMDQQDVPQTQNDQALVAAGAAGAAGADIAPEQTQPQQQHQQTDQDPISISPPRQSSSHPIPPAAQGTSGGGAGGADLGLHAMHFAMPPGPPPSSLPTPSLPAAHSHTHAPGPGAGSSSSSSALFPPLPQAPLSSLPYDPKLESLLHTPSHSSGSSSLQTLGGSMAGLPTVSLSDILARAAAQPSTNFSQALGSLGFAPEETLNDFVAMSYNPDLLDSNLDADPLLGSDLDQKAYYELLMGRRYT